MTAPLVGTDLESPRAILLDRERRSEQAAAT